MIGEHYTLFILQNRMKKILISNLNLEHFVKEDIWKMEGVL